MAESNEMGRKPEQASAGNNLPEGDGNRKATDTSAGNNPDESISTADDTANGKGSRTGIRKEEKEANDNFDKGRT